MFLIRGLTAEQTRASAFSNQHRNEVPYPYDDRQGPCRVVICVQDTARIPVRCREILGDRHNIHDRIYRCAYHLQGMGTWKSKCPLLSVSVGGIVGGWRTCKPRTMVSKEQGSNINDTKMRIRYLPFSSQGAKPNNFAISKHRGEYLVTRS